MNEEAAFNELSDDDQKDLEAWYNISRVNWTADDFRKLRELYEADRFQAWDCKCPCQCRKRVYVGEPEDWRNFQGVRQADYTSYPGSGEQTESYCDHCRCYHSD